MLVVGNADHPFGGNSSSEQCLRQPGAGLSCGKLTIAEEETQMVRQTDCHLTCWHALPSDKRGQALWAIFASPLLMSNDPRLISNESRAILLNREVIRVSQDPMGRQGRPVSAVWSPADGSQLWYRPLAGGDVAVVAHNPAAAPVDVHVPFEAVGFASDTRVAARDLFRRQDLGVLVGGAVAKGVAAHGVAMLRLSLP